METLTEYHQTRGQIRQEQDLIEAAKKDSAKFGVLYEKYYEPIFLFVLKRVESEDTAGDITSQVFLKALLNISKYRDMGLPFSSWLFRIARNEMYDLHSQHKIQMVVSIERTGLQEMIAEIGEEQRTDDAPLYAALEALDNDEMELIELRYFEKHSFKSIGGILDITENNAKVRTYRILEKLKKLIKP